MTGPVTALGIRDGDPDVLRALIARRGSAVVGYCERACAPAQVPIAAADAFAGFRALVAAAPRPADLDPEAALLSSVRHAAAARSPRGAAPPGGAGLGRLLGGRPTAEQITLVPELLIARAEGALDAEGDEQLNRLLDASAAARASEERFRAAEYAYRTATPRPLPEDLVVHIIATMQSVPADPAPAPATPPTPTPMAAAPVEPPAAEGDPARNGTAGDEAMASAPEEPEAPEEAPEEVAVPAGAPPAEAEAAGESAPPREWDVPPEEIGEREGMDVEIAAARLSDPAAHDLDEDDTGAAAAHLQTGSGAVDEPLVEEDAMDEPPAEEEALQELAEDVTPGDLPETPPEADEAPHEPAVPAAEAPRPSLAARSSTDTRQGMPGKGALAPAAAVVAVAAVSILATSGVFGGDESQPAVDTGVAPRATQVEVPEGEAAAVIGELRRSADDARRQRLAETGGVPAPAPVTPPEDLEEEAPAPDEDTGAAPAPAEPEVEGNAGGEAEGNAGAGGAPNESDETTSAEGEIAAEAGAAEAQPAP